MWAFLQTGAQQRDRGTLGRQRPLDFPADGDALRSHSCRRLACRSAASGEADADSRAGGAFANPYYWGPFQIYVGGAAPARNAAS